MASHHLIKQTGKNMSTILCSPLCVLLPRIKILIKMIIYDVPCPSSA